MAQIFHSDKTVLWPRQFVDGVGGKPRQTPVLNNLASRRNEKPAWKLIQVGF